MKDFGGLKAKEYYKDKQGLRYYWLREPENATRVLLVCLFLWLGIWGLSLEGTDNLSRGRIILRGMGPELAGIVIGVVAIDFLNERRQMQQLKAQLIRQMGSSHNEVADSAARELAHFGWLYDGSLQKAAFVAANLSKVNLQEADLGGAVFLKANLSGARLDEAELNRADFYKANLSGAVLNRSDLYRANLTNTNLSKATLLETNLSEAVLLEANLKDVKLSDVSQLEKALTLEGAVMPDGTQLGQEEGQWRNYIDDRMELIRWSKYISGESFENWKTRYTAK